jgi:nucleoside-diphosphate-sugar epimerase
MGAELPGRIEAEEELDELLTRPTGALVDFIRSVPSPLVVLGAGGKMGPTLAVLAKRSAAAAGHPLEVVAVSRFSDAKARAWLEAREVRTIPCDLLDAQAVRNLPGAEAVVYMVGLKFGTSRDPAATWAMNTVVPVRVLERYAQARIVALSTGNVYPPAEAAGGGWPESAPLTPLGEYANSAVGRERIFEFLSRRQGTAVTLLRLFYAVELRYGVVVDIARKVFGGQEVDLTSGCFNCIWQGDANEMVLRSLGLAACPPSVWNLCRPETFAVRAVAAGLGERLGRPVRFSGAEGPTALLGSSARLCQALGVPSVPLEAMLGWIAHWVERGGRDLAKPTHFEARDGNY